VGRKRQAHVLFKLILDNVAHIGLSNKSPIADGANIKIKNLLPKKIPGNQSVF
jgi:hypothetical protein